MKGAHGLWVGGHAPPSPQLESTLSPARQSTTGPRPTLPGEKEIRGDLASCWPFPQPSCATPSAHPPPPPSETDEKDGRLTRSKNDGIPEHEVVRAGCTRDAERRVGREPLEVPDQTTSARGGLRLSKAGSVSNTILTLTSAGLERSCRSGKGRQTDHVHSSRGSGSNRRWVGGGGKDVVRGQGPYSRDRSRDGDKRQPS